MISPAPAFQALHFLLIILLIPRTSLSHKIGEEDKIVSALFQC